MTENRQSGPVRTILTLRSFGSSFAMRCSTEYYVKAADLQPCWDGFCRPSFLQAGEPNLKNSVTRDGMRCQPKTGIGQLFSGNHTFQRGRGDTPSGDPCRTTARISYSLLLPQVNGKCGKWFTCAGGAGGAGGADGAGDAGDAGGAGGAGDAGDAGHLGLWPLVVYSGDDVPATKSFSIRSSAQTVRLPMDSKVR